jgi:hypothetical protein
VENSDKSKEVKQAVQISEDFKQMKLMKSEEGRKVVAIQ